MAIDYKKLGIRISSIRSDKEMSQEELGRLIDVSNKHISNIETGKRSPSLDSLIDIANALEVSADDLLVDSLTHSTSTAGSELHQLLLDCNQLEKEILIRTIKELKQILYGLGI